MVIQIIKHFLISAFCVITFLLGVVLFIVDHEWVDFSKLTHARPLIPSILLDDEGVEWARFQLDRREPITYDRLPSVLINAFVAAEDWEFFNHSGIAFKSIIRSLLVNLYHRRIVQGASTITQQLVKLLFFNAEKTFVRKIKEQCCALAVERQFTKEQIFETYVNHVYFGCGIYGVQAASQRFWGCDVQELDVNQAAILAGIVRSPARYCPLINTHEIQKRRNIVLNNMVRLHFITQQECETASALPIVVKEQQEYVCAPHLKETLRIQLEELLGKDQLYGGGLIIQTTLNQPLQRHAQEVFKKHIMQLRSTFSLPIDGGLMAINRNTGEIKVLIGGHDYNHSKFNRAMQARRQLGSVFKPLVYAVGLQTGMKFYDIQEDEPIEIMQSGQSWKPRNYNRKFNGTITLAYALSHSNNIVTIKTLLNVGAEPVIDLAKKCRLPGPFHTYPSLALGTIDATLKEAVGMFNIFAHNGIYTEPHMIHWIKDQWGNKIYKQQVVSERVLSSRINDQVAQVLGLGVLRARNYFKNEWIDVQAIGKTGTTNDSRTCWYIGSTPTLTTGVYIGCDDNCSMGQDIYPIKTALPIWLAFNKYIMHKQKQFSFDSSLREFIIHEKTGEPLLNMYNPNAIKILI